METLGHPLQAQGQGLAVQSSSRALVRLGAAIRRVRQQRAQQRLSACAPCTFRAGAIKDGGARTSMADFGTIRFEGRRQTARYLRLADSREPFESQREYVKRIINFLHHHWGLSQPKLVLTVTGAAGSTVTFPNAKMEADVKRALRDAVVATEGISFSGGTSQGVMKFLGEALTSDGRHDAPTLIGVTGWSKAFGGGSAQPIVTYEEWDGDRKFGRTSWALPTAGSAPLLLADNQGGERLYPSSRDAGGLGHSAAGDKYSTQVAGAFLDVCHSNFLMVDDGSYGADAKWASEVALRAAIERALCEVLPSLAIVAGGGPGTVKSLLETCKEGTPAVLLADTGGVASMLSHALENGSTAGYEAPKDGTPPEHAKRIVEAVESALAEFLELRMHLTVWRTSSEKPLDVVIRTLISLGDRSSPAVQLQWAVGWDSPKEVMELVSIVDKEALLAGVRQAARSGTSSTLPPRPISTGSAEILVILCKEVHDILDAASKSMSAHKRTKNVDLSHINARGRNLDNLHLLGARMRHAGLQTCSLVGAKLRATDLSGSICKLTNLKDADLRQANLAGCDFSMANFEGANVSGVVWSPFKVPAKRTVPPRRGAWRSKAVAAGVGSALLSSLGDGEDDDDDGDAGSDDEGDDEGGGSAAAQWQKAASSVLNRALGSVVASARHVVRAAEELRDKLRREVLGERLLSLAAASVEDAIRPLLSQVRKGGAAPEHAALVAAIKPALETAMARLLDECFQRLLPKLLAEAEASARAQRSRIGDGGSGGGDGGSGGVDGDVEADGDVAADGDGAQSDLEAGERDEAAAHAMTKLVFDQLRADALMSALRRAVEEKLSTMLPLAADICAKEATKLAPAAARAGRAVDRAREAAERANEEVDKLERGQASTQASAVAAQLRLLCGNALSALEERLESSIRSLLHARAGAAAGGSEQSGRPIRKLLSSFEAYETRLSKLLERDGGAAQLAKRYAPSGQLKASVINGVLTAASKYEIRDGASLGMLRLACARSRHELTKDENELAYLLEKLQQVEQKETTEMAWRDTYESWQGLLKLRSQILVERGQAVLDCIVADEKVLRALAASTQLYKTIGKPPDALLRLINEGPGAHIRTHAYKYRSQIDKELATIRRLKELQARFIALLGSAILAGLVGVSNFGSRAAYNAWIGGES